MTPGEEITDQWLPRDVLAEPGVLEGRGDRLEVRVGMPLSAVEKQVILATLAHFNHHKERTAATLGVSLKTLYNRLKEYGL
jgi:DNA-binding NtrC family response regulator